MRVPAQSRTLPSAFLPQTALPLAGLILLAAGCLARAIQSADLHPSALEGAGMLIGAAMAGLALAQVVGRR